jgi:hypothetical protein
VLAAWCPNGGFLTACLACIAAVLAKTLSARPEIQALRPFVNTSYRHVFLFRCPGRTARPKDKISCVRRFLDRSPPH